MLATQRDLRARVARVSELREQRALAVQATGLLGRHPAVAAVTPMGSMASAEADGFPADDYSDVDLRVDLIGLSDRAFVVEELPALVEECGRVCATAWVVLPGVYGVQSWFDDRSVFCGLDVACHSDVHEDGDDMHAATGWTRPFANWLLVAKRVLRLSDLTTTYVAGSLATTPDVISPLLPTLSRLLDDVCGDARKRGVDYADLESLCRRGLVEVERHRDKAVGDC